MGRNKINHIITENQAEVLFYLIDGKGECVTESLHIINTTSHPEAQGYRIYHKDGYCIDVKKTAEFDDNGEYLGWDYSCLQEFDDFRKIEIKTLIKVVKREI